MPRFEWDRAKAEANLRKHSIAFSDAAAVWADPFCFFRLDPAAVTEERWHALGMLGSLLLMVVHTYPEGDEHEVVRIVSARRATRQERRTYEDGDF